MNNATKMMVHYLWRCHSQNLEALNKKEILEDGLGYKEAVDWAISQTTVTFAELIRDLENLNEAEVDNFSVKDYLERAAKEAMDKT